MFQSIVYILQSINFIDIDPSDINECLSSACFNGATCEDLVNGYTCTCMAGTQGDRCQYGK